MKIRNLIQHFKKKKLKKSRYMEIQQMLLDQQFSSLFGLRLHPTAEAISRPQLHVIT